MLPQTYPRTNLANSFFFFFIRQNGPLDSFLLIFFYYYLLNSPMIIEKKIRLGKKPHLNSPMIIGKEKKNQAGKNPPRPSLLPNLPSFFLNSFSAQLSPIYFYLFLFLKGVDFFFKKNCASLFFDLFLIKRKNR